MRYSARIQKRPGRNSWPFCFAWEQRKLKELGDILTGSTPSTSHEEFYSETGIPWVTPSDITSNQINISQKKLSVEGERIARIVPPNTILVTCIASIGKNALLQVRGSFNQQINSLTPYENNDPYFLISESELWSAGMKREAASATMQIVNKKDFSEIETLIPKKAEQQKIGSFFRNLDHLITLHQSKCFSVNKKHDQVINQFTTAWEQRKLGTFIKEINRHDAESTAPVMMIAAATGFIEQSEKYSSDNAGQSLAKYTILHRGELAYNHGASKYRKYGSCFALTIDTARVPFVYHCFDVRPYNPYFVALILNIPQIDTQLRKLVSSGARMDGLLNISFEAYKTIEIMLPEKLEQDKISIFLAKFDHLITLHQRKSDNFSKSNSLMSKKSFLKNEPFDFDLPNTKLAYTWEQRKLSHYLETSLEKNTNNLYGKRDVLSVSGDFGIVNQIEFQGRSFAGASVSNYGIVHTYDIVYTKSPLKANPFGIIKTNKGKTGIVSTLYAIYHPFPCITDSVFVQCYFEQDERLNSYLHPLVNKGAKNDMKVTDDNALKGNVSFPILAEQHKISTLFSVLDHLITLHQREYLLLEVLLC